MDILRRRSFVFFNFNIFEIECVDKIANNNRAKGIYVYVKNIHVSDFSLLSKTTNSRYDDWINKNIKLN